MLQWQVYIGRGRKAWNIAEDPIYIPQWRKDNLSTNGGRITGQPPAKPWMYTQILNPSQKSTKYITQNIKLLESNTVENLMILDIAIIFRYNTKEPINERNNW